MRVEELNFINYISDKFNRNITVADVGANIGNYSAHLVKILNDRIKKGYIFEPIKSCYDRIERWNNFSYFNIGVGAGRSEVKFYEAIGKESHSSIVNRERLYAKPKYNIRERIIKIDCLDNIISERLNVLKIDTEGYELEVLRGCNKLLKEGNIDYIQFEYGGCFKDNNITLNDVINFLEQYGYGVYELCNGSFKPITSYRDDFRWVNYFSKKNNK
jgi:FkbM family methyltransferase